MVRSEVLAYLDDGPHGGKTVLVRAESDGSAPRQIELPGVPLPPQANEESSLRHSVPTGSAAYCLAASGRRAGGGYVYRLVRDRTDDRSAQD